MCVFQIQSGVRTCESRPWHQIPTHNADDLCQSLRRSSEHFTQKSGGSNPDSAFWILLRTLDLQPQTPDAEFRILASKLRMEPSGFILSTDSGPVSPDPGFNPGIPICQCKSQIPDSVRSSWCLLVGWACEVQGPGWKPVAADFAELGDPPSVPLKAGWNVPRAGDGHEMQPRRHQRWANPSLVGLWSSFWGSPANVDTDWTSGGRTAPFLFLIPGGRLRAQTGQ